MTRLMYTALAVHMSAFPTAITLITWSTATCTIHMEIIVMITGPLQLDASLDAGASVTLVGGRRRDYSQAARETAGVARIEPFRSSATGSSHGRGIWVNSIN